MSPAKRRPFPAVYTAPPCIFLCAGGGWIVKKRYINYIISLKKPRIQQLPSGTRLERSIFLHDALVVLLRCHQFEVYDGEFLLHQFQFLSELLLSLESALEGLGGWVDRNGNFEGENKWRHVCVSL